MMKRLSLFFMGCLLMTVTMLAQGHFRGDFVKGADVGFLAGQELRGVKFHDRNGQERECLELLRNDYQMSAIRLRVWVNPRGGDCDKYALLSMARRVKALGMDLMVDFHYSDWWADPAKQPIPKAWLGHSFEQMKQDLRNHTVEVLTLLKQNGITPRWVQVGNETTNGMLWSVKTNEYGWEVKDSLGRTTITHSMGHIKTEPQQYAGFIRAGYDAVKEVFPDAIVIVHLDRGHEQSLYDHNLDTILKYGGKFDMIGMSLYPYWAREGHPELKADDIISDCIKNIRYVSRKYGCDVMIVETGYEVDEQRPEVMEEGRRQLSRVIREARYATNGRCRGVFYWEPQCLPGGYKLGAFDSKGAPTAIMEAFVEEQMAPLAHDPVMAKEGDTYYLFSTGMGIQQMTSKDRKTWTPLRQPVMTVIPGWTTDSVPGFRGHVWAPDIIRWHDRWWLAYSCSTFGKNGSAIGLLSCPSLRFNMWQDEGCIVTSRQKRDNWNAIDPNFIIDDNDQPWLVWGSFWDGIQLAPLDSTMHLDNNRYPRTIARRYDPNYKPTEPNPTSKYAGTNAIEAPFIFKHGGYYYLFVSWDYCCRGAKSNYRVAVGRSKTVDGPYLDRDGKDMTSGGGTIFFEGDKKEWEAVGHCAVYNFDGEDIFICHGYSATLNGAALLIQRPISWTADGWPELTF